MEKGIKSIYFSEMNRVYEDMHYFSKAHYYLKKNIFELIEITEQNKNDKNRYEILFCSCLVNFFSMIDIELYRLNYIDQYYKYSEKDKFIDKFRNTLNEFGDSWVERENRKRFSDTRLKEIDYFRQIRDKLLFPKKFANYYLANNNDFEKIKSTFNYYNNFIEFFMDDFFKLYDYCMEHRM